MISWIRRLFGRFEPETPDIGPFLDRTRALRANAIREQQASVEATRKLRANFFEQDLLDRLNERRRGDA